MKIKFAYGIVPGAAIGGLKTKTREKISTAYENGVAVIFLAGPAAGIAAELTAERFDELYVSDSGFIKETLTGKKKDGTMLFVAVKGNRYLAGHMGEGMIVRLDGRCTVLSKPKEGDHGELRVYKGEVQEPFGFMLMSDGACRSLYESDAAALSPACGTFFEWLKEYDEETVCEALTDNMNKYFIKDVKGDISVGIMVSEEETEEIVESAETEEVTETDEPAAELPETTEPEREPAVLSGKGSILKYLIAALVIAAILFVFAMKPDAPEPKDAAKPETEPPVTSSEDIGQPAADPAAETENKEPPVTFTSKDPVYYDAGVYQVGGDIPEGEYFFWTGEMLKPDSIRVNDDTCLSGELYCMTVSVEGGDTLTTDVRFTAAENVEPVKAVNGTLISGKYKIGKDIAPGTYRIAPKDPNAEGKYYSILNGEISNDEAFSGETTVEVPEKGYIVIYNAVLTVGQN